MKDEQIQLAHAVIYYDNQHASLEYPNQLWTVKMYLLDDDYLVVNKRLGDVYVMAFTDLTTAREQLNEVVKEIEEGFYNE